MSIQAVHSSMGTDGVVRCYHNVPAAKRKSQTAANPDRFFYACAKDRLAPERCKFFLWADELQNRAPQTPESAPSSSQTHSSSQTSHLPSPPSPTPRSSTKRERAPGFQPYEITPNEKRFKIIEATISQSTSEIARTSNDFSTRLDSGDSYLQLDSDDNPFYDASQGSKSPSNSQRNGYSSHGRGDEQETNAGPSVPMTPPNTNHRRGINFLHNPLPFESPTVDKGKGRAQGSLGSDWRGSQLDSPLSNSQPLHFGADEISADLIANMVDALSDIPAYVRKLERKNIAAERSNEAKKKRIEELEFEIETLKETQKELEDKLSLMQPF